MTCIMLGLTLPNPEHTHFLVITVKDKGRVNYFEYLINPGTLFNRV